jgi:predicted dehydrogenase
VRGAIVGLGNVAVHGHLPGWLERPDVEIVAVSDMRPAQRAVGTERLPEAHWFDSAESLLAGHALDFVDICTPPSSHARLIRAALERGVHVLCEKPLVRSADELGSRDRAGPGVGMRAPYRPQLASRPHRQARRRSPARG